MSTLSLRGSESGQPFGRPPSIATGQPTGSLLPISSILLLPLEFIDAVARQSLRPDFSAGSTMKRVLLLTILSLTGISYQQKRISTFPHAISEQLRAYSDQQSFQLKNTLFTTLFKLLCLSVIFTYQIAFHNL